MFITAPTSHPPMSALNSARSPKSEYMLVTRETSQSFMSAPHAGPQSAPPVEQQSTPEGTAARHLATAAKSEPCEGNGAGASHDDARKGFQADGGPSS